MKELEQEAERYARRFEENELDNYSGESLSIEDRIEMEAFVAGATSKHVEKQKLEFAIEQIKEIDKKCFGGSNTCKAKIKELEKKLKEL